MTSFFTILFFLIPFLVSGQPEVYPSSAGVIDVTKAPYFVDNTGSTDASVGINQALEDFNDAHMIIYLPAGTYLASNPIRWGRPEGCDITGTFTCHRYTILAGEGPDKTIIKLADNNPEYQDINDPEIMIWTYTSAAMSFENSIRNLSIHTGSGNPGVIALGFEANNQGGVFNVNIKSDDRQGQVGLHLGTGDQAGPCLIKNVRIEGYDTGIETFANQNSLYFENIFLKDQNALGVFNRQQSIAIKDLYSENEVPVIHNHNDGGSTVTLINSTLVGTGEASATSAILNYNTNPFFIRNVTVSGYQNGLQQLQNGFSLETVDSGFIEEYTTNSPISICDNLKKSLNLLIAESPTIIYEDTSLWVSITDPLYGAEIDNGFLGEGSEQDDTPAIQMALNSGASTILIPGPGGQFPNRFLAYDTIDIPASVKHLIGAKGKISGDAVWRILPGTDTLIIEDFAELGEIIHASSRVIYIKNASIKDYFSLSDGTSGDVFIEDVVGGPYFFKNQNVWARQLNSEDEEINIVNDGGNVWLFGHKTEMKGTSTYSLNGANTEILGSLFYTTTAENNPPSPIHVVEESNFSIAGFKEINYINDAYDIKVREIRNGQVEDFTMGNVSIQTDLFVAYVDDSAPNMAPVVTLGDDQIMLLSENNIFLEAEYKDDGLPSKDCFADIQWSLVYGPGSAVIDDPASRGTTFTFTESGEYMFQIEVSDGDLMDSDSVIVHVFDNYSSTLDHDQDDIPSGNGADANLRGWDHALKNYGGSTGFGPRNYNIFPAKSIFRIDVSQIDSASLEHCLLELEIATSNTGVIENWEYNIFGLMDGHSGEDWIEGNNDGVEDVTGPVNYDNAPGFSDTNGGVYDVADITSGGVNHEEAIFLGVVKTREGRQEKISLHSEALTDFINADMTGSVTFLMTRASFDINTINFATKENPTYNAPRLYYNNCAGIHDSLFLQVNAGEVINGVSVTTDTSWIDVSYDANNCLATTSYFISILSSTHNIKWSQETYRIYPNPFMQRLFITPVIENKEPFSLEIFNVMGQIVFKQHYDRETFLNGNGFLEIDFKDLESGIYFAKIYSDKTKQVVRLLHH